MDRVRCDFWNKLENIEWKEFEENDKKRESKHFFIKPYLVSDISKKTLRTISPEMRKIVVEWLIQVRDDLKFEGYITKDDCLNDSINFLDRFCAKRTFSATNYQLLAVTCLFIAVKNQGSEILPYLNDDKKDRKVNATLMNAYTDNTYTSEKVLKMEEIILKVLEWDVNIYSAYYFLQRYLEKYGELFSILKEHYAILPDVFKDRDNFVDYKNNCYFLSELCLLEIWISNTSPSSIAASIMIVIFTISPFIDGNNVKMNMLFDTKPFSIKDILDISNKKIEDLLPIIKNIIDLVIDFNNNDHNSIGEEKYLKNRYKEENVTIFSKIPNGFYLQPNIYPELQRLLSSYNNNKRDFDECNSDYEDNETCLSPTDRNTYDSDDDWDGLSPPKNKQLKRSHKNEDYNNNNNNNNNSNI